MSLRCQVLWLFRVKARLRGVGSKSHDDEVLSDMEKGGYQVDRMFREGQTEPRAVFIGCGGAYVQSKNVVPVGLALKDGMSNNEASRATGVDQETVSRVRQAINQYRGIPFMCKCGRVGGHMAQNSKTEENPCPKQPKQAVA